MNEVLFKSLDATSIAIKEATTRLFEALNASAPSGRPADLEQLGKALFDLDDRLVTKKVEAVRALARGAPQDVDFGALLSLRSEFQGLLLSLVQAGIEIAAQPSEQGAGSSPDAHNAVSSSTAVVPQSSSPSPGASERTGAAILEVAKRHVGQRYVNRRIDYTDPDWKGPFDCAEFASYCVWRAYGMLYGARLDAGTGSVPTRDNVEAYTGFWKEDVTTRGKVIDSEAAFGIAGAFVLRFPPAAGTMGHIAICVGDGISTYEAADFNRGVIKGSLKGSDGTPRRWDVGVLIPGVNYGKGPIVVDQARIYRAIEPPLPYDEVVEIVQQKLVMLGLLAKEGVDGEFGKETAAAVAAFQRARGLVVDGEVGPDTGGALGLGEIWGTPGKKPLDIDQASARGADGGSPVGAKPLLRTRKFGVIAQEYVDMYGAAIVRPNWRTKVTKVADQLLTNRRRYEKVAESVGRIPWFVIGAIHNMESSLSFKSHLHNGDPLTERTRKEPAGRPSAPPANGSTYTWEESAIDALKGEGFSEMSDWSLSRILHRLEAYNGFGSRELHGVPSAYLWSGTSQWEKGKYVDDHKWDGGAPSSQVGCAAVLKILQERDEINF